MIRAKLSLDDVLPSDKEMKLQFINPEFLIGDLAIYEGNIIVKTDTILDIEVCIKLSFFVKTCSKYPYVNPLDVDLIIKLNDKNIKEEHTKFNNGDVKVLKLRTLNQVNTNDIVSVHILHSSSDSIKIYKNINHTCLTIRD
jgi:hypothetical protein